MLKEEIRSDLGKAIIKPDQPVKAASRYTIKITYYPGSEGIKKGGSIRITIPHPFPTPQIHEFYKDGFVTVRCSRDDVKLSLHLELSIFCAYHPEVSHSGAFGKSVFVRVDQGNLKEYDFFELTYGNISYYGNEFWGPKPLRMPKLSGRYEFTIAVDPGDQNKAPLTGYYLLNKSPVLEVIPQKIAKIIPITPSLTNDDNNIHMKVLMSDRYQNPIEKKVKNFTIRLANHNKYYQESNNFEIKYQQIDKQFFHYHLVYNNGKKEFQGITNPIKFGKYMDHHQLFWGDLHTHTRYSDGMGKPEDALLFARDTANLDFAAISDHDDIGPYLSQKEWEDTKKQIRLFNKPGRFVTFLGYEYRSSLADMNVYYPRDEGEVLCGKEKSYQSPEGLNQWIKQKEGMIIPHMHFGADWRGYDSTIYRVMEIYSQHGSAEYIGCFKQIPFLNNQLQKGNKGNINTTFQEILELGMKMGVTAGSDSHSGRPGLSNWTRVTRTYNGGLTAVFAKEKTRESIWKALHERHCYATTGARIYLEFSINGYSMGSEIKANKRKLDICCIGTYSKFQINVIKNNKIIYRTESNSFKCKFFIDDIAERDEDFYYVRIIQQDKEMAWSSPIWIGKE